MSDKERLVQFEFLGLEHTFYTAASEEEVEKILSLVRSLADSNPSSSPGTLASGKVAVLACLNIASRYVTLEREFKEYRENSVTRISRLNKEISAKMSAE